MEQIITKVGSKFGHILNKPWRNYQRLKKLPKWQNLAKSGHTKQQQRLVSASSFLQQNLSRELQHDNDDHDALEPELNCPNHEPSMQ